MDIVDSTVIRVALNRLVLDHVCGSGTSASTSTLPTWLQVAGLEILLVLGALNEPVTALVTVRAIACLFSTLLLRFSGI